MTAASLSAQQKAFRLVLVHDNLRNLPRLTGFVVVNVYRDTRMNPRHFNCFTIPIYINHRITEGIAHRIGNTDLANHESLPRREGCDHTLGRRRGGCRRSVTLADDRILGRRLGCRGARLRQSQWSNGAGTQLLQESFSFFLLGCKFRISLSVAISIISLSNRVCVYWLSRRR